jgi:hypothetical protein
MTTNRHQKLLVQWDIERKKWCKTDAKEEDPGQLIYWMSPMDLEGFDIE